VRGHQELEDNSDFSSLSDSGDGIGLLVLIKVITLNFQSQKYLPHSLHEAKKRLYACIQYRHSSVQTCLEQFQNFVDVIEHCGRHQDHDSGLIKLVSAVPTEDSYSSPGSQPCYLFHPRG
jgi:hypothetical protein